MRPYRVYARVASNTINITNDSCNARKTCSSTRHDTNVLISVLGYLSFAVCYVIEIGNGLSKFYGHLSRSKKQTQMGLNSAYF